MSSNIIKVAEIKLYRKENDHCQSGFVDDKGVWVIPPVYDCVWDFSEGLAMVKKDWKCGYIDDEGNIVIPLKYYRACPFNDGIAKVMPKIGGNWIFIDKAGNKVPME